MAHARFAPSSAQRVYDCPASLQLNEIGPGTTSRDAAQGTAAHFVAELCGRKKTRAEKYAGCIVGVMSNGETYFVHAKNSAPAEGEGFAFEVDDEMVGAVQEYVDWCFDAPGKHHFECRVNISPWCPQEGQFGTADHVALNSTDLYVTDLKYGTGVQVFAHENLQAVLYALGALLEFDSWDEVERIHIRVCQPRLNHKDTWTVSRAELLAWGVRIRERFTLALLPDPPFGPTDKACKFCRVAARCRALADHLSAHRALAFDNVSDGFAVDDPRLLTDDELVSAWRITSLLKSRITAVAKEVMRVLLDGGDLPGVKLAEAQTRRQFKNQKEVEAFLMLDCNIDRDKLFSSKLLSPNQVEKMLAKPQRKELAGYIYKPAGGPCIVDASSSRPAYAASGRVDLDSVFAEEIDFDET
ncbi:MAG: hypothetical protein DDT26_00277 [Dehalococcoidia bacterium]|nr:hypothetical protein [Chloroflexota bacterium]